MLNHQARVPYIGTRGAKKQGQVNPAGADEGEGSFLLSSGRNTSVSLLSLQGCFSVLPQPLGCLNGSWLWGWEGEEGEVSGKR